MPEKTAFARFQIEHIIPIKHHGSSELDNLAWACLQCNAAKSSNLVAYDLETGELTPLYNPRAQTWRDHFEIREALIIGKTSVGRVTIDVLDMNCSEQLSLREALIQRNQW